MSTDASIPITSNPERSELERKNERLQLLLNLTNRITSNLEFRELLRSISANVREVMQCDAVAISLPDVASGKRRLYALDFPRGKGFFKEDLLITPAKDDGEQRALETLAPVTLSGAEAANFSHEAQELGTATERDFRRVTRRLCAMIRAQVKSLGSFIPIKTSLMVELKHLQCETSDLDEDAFSIERPEQEPAEHDHQHGIEERGILGVHAQPIQVEIQILLPQDGLPSREMSVISVRQATNQRIGGKTNDRVHTKYQRGSCPASAPAFDLHHPEQDGHRHQ